MASIDVLSSSLIDSSVSLKWKQWNNKELGTCSLAHSTLGVWGHARAPRWDLEEWQVLNHSHKLAQNQTTNWSMHSWSTFGVRTSHKQTWTHKTHHDLDLGEATTFPLIIYFVLLHEAHIQMAFCPKLPNGSPEIPKVGIPSTLGVHNFVWKFRLRWGLMKSYSPCQVLSNNMLHAT